MEIALTIDTGILDSNYRNRYRVLFENAGEKNLLTNCLISFSYDLIKREFIMVFRLPKQYHEEFRIALFDFDKFTLEALDGDNNVTSTEFFELDQFISAVTEYDYSSIKPVDMKVIGKYL